MKLILVAIKYIYVKQQKIFKVNTAVTVLYCAISIECSRCGAGHNKLPVKAM